MQMWTKGVFLFFYFSLFMLWTKFQQGTQGNLYLPYLWSCKSFCCFFWGEGGFLLSVNFFENPFPLFLSGLKTNYSFVWIF